MDEHQQQVVVDFLSEHWAQFESHCEERGEDPQEIYENLGGED